MQRSAPPFLSSMGPADMVRFHALNQVLQPLVSREKCAKSSCKFIQMHGTRQWVVALEVLTRQPSLRAVPAAGVDPSSSSRLTHAG